MYDDELIEYTLAGTPRKRKAGGGRRPNHGPVNRYTGIRAQNVERVRGYLRHWLELEKGFGTPLNKMVVNCMRLLLACENVYMRAPTSKTAWAKRQKRIVELGEGIKTGAITLPQLLEEIDTLEANEVRAEEVEDDV